jgi:PIN domain nuclease of toxin-antitoxin system
MPQYVADTHSIVWYFTDDPQLSEKALNAFDQTTENGLIIIPTIVLAEIIFIAQKGRIALTFQDTLKRIEEYENFKIVSLDIEVLKKVDKIQ